MLVKEFLSVLDADVEVKVHQDPIKEIDPYAMLPVERFRGTARTARRSNQNYLDFEIYAVRTSAPAYIDIFCRANETQKSSIVRAHREGR